MNPPDLLDRLEQLNLWRRGDERAPHKPLLLLLALAKLETQGPGLISYADIAESLRALLNDFGPSRPNHHPEYPFRYLANDGIWTIKLQRTGVVREGVPDHPTHRQLLEAEARGGFTPDVASVLQSDPDLRRQVIERLLEAHFAPTLHDEILSAVGLDAKWETVSRRVRDPDFRNRILAAWSSRCGVCDFDVEVHDSSVGLDAAHIQWKQYEGPDIPANGIALCSLHHRLFDRGAFTIEPAEQPEHRRVLVSEQARGTRDLDSSLLRYHRKMLEGPENPDHRPAPTFLVWHRSQVFREPSRD